MQTITINTESPNEATLAAQSTMLTIEPIVLAPDRLIKVLRKMDAADFPNTLMELQRLGVPRYVGRWLMGFANDTITEKELVNAFARHLVNRTQSSTTGSDFLRRLWSRESLVLNDPALTTDERLVLHSLNAIAGPVTDSWLDLTGAEALNAPAWLA